MLKKNIIERLINIDNEIYHAYGNKHRFEFIIVGGSALVLNFDSTRGTPDIDVLEMNKDVINIANKYDMNCQANAYILYFPYNFKDRLIPLNEIEFKVCKFYTPSLEDLVVSKIAAFRDKDIEDLNSDYVLSKLNWNKLIKIVEEDKEFELASISHSEVFDFMCRYNKYKKEHYKK